MLYNVYLLKKYETYLNIEVYTFTKSMRYLYKYIFKKNDFVDIFITIILVINRRVNQSLTYRNDNEISINEMSIFYDARWIDFYETTWRILDLFVDETNFSI